MKGLHVEDILRRMMHVSGSRNQADLAATLGVQRAAVTDAKRRGAVPPDWYMRLCRLYGANPVWLETGLGAERLGDPEAGPGEDFVLVAEAAQPPRVGPGGFLAASGDEDGDGGEGRRHAVRRDLLARAARGAPEDLLFLPVAGDAMEPTLRDGDLALVDQAQREPVYGKIHALAVDGRVLVRRLDARPGRLVIVSDNRGYPPLETPLAEAAAVRILGRVIWIGRENP